jgi:acyl-coenzyme A thioesterase 13
MAHSEQKQPSEVLEHVEQVWARMQPNSPIYEFLLSDVEILAASKSGSITARMEVKPCHLNSKNTLHGTVSACITDWAGSLCVAATGREKVGASTDIHTSFVSTAKEGDLLTISARAAKIGGTLAFTTVEIERAGENGESIVVTTGSHTKYVKQ